MALTLLQNGQFLSSLAKNGSHLLVASHDARKLFSSLHVHCDPAIPASFLATDTSPRTQRGIAASLCSAHELYYAEPPSNQSLVERNLTEICVLALALAELVTPPAMRHHAESSATMIADSMLADLRSSHHAFARQPDGISLR